MYTHDFKSTLQVYLVDLFNSIFNILYFSIFNHASCVIHNVLNVVFRKLIPLMCMRSKHRLIFLHLSIMPLCKFHIMIGSTSLILWRTILLYRCGILGPYMSSAILTSSRRIGRFFRMLLSTKCRIWFIGWPVIFWNRLAQSALFASWAVYCLFVSSTCGMGGVVGGYSP